MTALQRASVVEQLPSEFPLTGPGVCFLPEGIPHQEAVMRAWEPLLFHFRSRNRRIFFARDMAVYYPGEEVFAPDTMAVLDVDDDRTRTSWCVNAEGKGLDLCIEVVSPGSKRKDLEANVVRYARLGIREYFVHEPHNCELTGFRGERLPGRYVPIRPHNGLLRSEVLGLDFSVIGDCLRVLHNGAIVPLFGEAYDAAKEETRQEREMRLRAQAEARQEREMRVRAQAEAADRAQLAEQLADRLAEAHAVIEKLGKQTP